MFNIHDEIRANQRRSLFIIIMFFLFIGLLGAMAGIVLGVYANGNLFDVQSIIFTTVLALIISLVYIAIFMSSGANMILKATGATEADRKTYPFLYHTTEALSLAAGMKKPPKCYVIDDTALNAYATGFKAEDSYIVVTTGLMEKLNREELEGVLAHEMSHIKNQDIKVMLLAAGLVGATILLADLLFRIFLFAPRGGGGGEGENKNGVFIIVVLVFWLVLVITAPLVGEMIRLAISRQREYLADASGAKLTRYPEGLASKIKKIKNDPDPLVDRANKSTAHLFISTPFRQKKGPSLMQKLFATHPPIDDRIARLRG
ncbi:MAG: M48 family metallopeptidase, partial [Nanoarchaeota archaeon]|nr:M48 family metallopeptidase [Nanoarchaeota archaeon]